LSLNPKGCLENAVSEIKTISCDNWETYEIGCQILLITNRKSYGLSYGTDLDDLEWP